MSLDYESASSENLSQAVLVATVLEHAPSPYREFLRQAHESNRRAYRDVKEYLRDYLNVDMGYGQTAIPMQVDAAT